MSDGRRQTRQQAPYGDPVNAPFWEATCEHRLLFQQCDDCGHRQFYGRPFCLKCQSDALRWRQASGRGRVYSATCIHVSWIDDFEAPYFVALVDLDEGPRLLTNIVNGPAGIGDPVRLRWRERSGAPPIPVFEPDPTAQ